MLPLKIYHNLSLCIWWLCTEAREAQQKKKVATIMPALFPVISKIPSDTSLAMQQNIELLLFKTLNDPLN